MFATQKGRSNPVRTSCSRCENAKSVSSDRDLLDRCCEALSNHSYANARDAHDFVAAALASGNRNGRARHAQKFREELDHGGVGLAIDRWSRQFKLQCIAERSSDAIAL